MSSSSNLCGSHSLHNPCRSLETVKPARLTWWCLEYSLFDIISPPGRRASLAPHKGRRVPHVRQIFVWQRLDSAFLSSTLGCFETLVASSIDEPTPQPVQLQRMVRRLQQSIENSWRAKRRRTLQGEKEKKILKEESKTIENQQQYQWKSRPKMTRHDGSRPVDENQQAVKRR